LVFQLWLGRGNYALAARYVAAQVKFRGKKPHHYNHQFSKWDGISAFLSFAADPAATLKSPPALKHNMVCTDLRLTISNFVVFLSVI